MIVLDDVAGDGAGVLGEDLAVVLAAADALALLDVGGRREQRGEARVGAHQLGRVGGAVLRRVDVLPADGQRELGVDLAVDGDDRHVERLARRARR